MKPELKVPSALNVAAPVKVVAPVTAKVPPIDTLLPIVVAAKTTPDGIAAIAMATNKDIIFCLRYICYVLKF